jgi:SAM-dependent methyltransferase
MPGSGRLRLYLAAMAAALTRVPRLERCEICRGRRPQVWTQAGYRNGLRCLSCRATPTHRAIWRVLEDELGASLPGARILQLGGHGALDRALRRRCPRYVPTEYFPEVPLGELGPSRLVCQDVRRLTYPDGSFDLVVSTEVFEHVAGYERGLAEVRRVLAPGGCHVFTVPLSNGRPTTLRAREGPDGAIEHLLPPEYHGDPLRDRGALVFQDFGSDIARIVGAHGMPSHIERVTLDPREPAIEVIVSRRPAA